MADKKAPGSERAAERAAAAQQNSERARLAPRSSYVNMEVSGVDLVSRVFLWWPVNRGWSHRQLSEQFNLVPAALAYF